MEPWTCEAGLVVLFASVVLRISPTTGWFLFLGSFEIIQNRRPSWGPIVDTMVLSAFDSCAFARISYSGCISHTPGISSGLPSWIVRIWNPNLCRNQNQVLKRSTQNVQNQEGGHSYWPRAQTPGGSMWNDPPKPCAYHVQFE